jgi:hypothetical protein
MANAYGAFIEGWNTYVRDFGVLVGRPGLLKSSLDRFSSTHASVTKRVKQFAALLYGEEERLGASQKQIPPDAASHKIEDVVNQTFRNQEVPLDGYQYISCIFENVTFVYNNGVTGGFDSSSRWTGSVGFKSREARIQQILGFLQGLKIIPPQTTHGLYTPILADLPDPASDAVIIKTPAELASYWSRLISARGTSNEKFADMENTYEYVLNFWIELEQNRGSARQKWVEKTFPGNSLTPEQIDEFRDKYLAGAKAWRASLVTLLNLLAFQFPKLGV